MNFLTPAIVLSVVTYLLITEIFYLLLSAPANEYPSASANRKMILATSLVALLWPLIVFQYIAVASGIIIVRIVEWGSDDDLVD